jgi:hypothetical protein
VGADTPLHPYTDLHLARLLILFLLAIHECITQPFFAFACDSSPGSMVTPRAHRHSYLLFIALACAPAPGTLTPLRKQNKHFHTGLRIGVMFHHAHSRSHASCLFVLPPAVVCLDYLLRDTLVLGMGSNSSAFGSGDVVFRLDKPND